MPPTKDEPRGHLLHDLRTPLNQIIGYSEMLEEEARDLDWEGLLAEGDTLIVEWPERAGPWLPSPTHRFRLHHLPDPDRRGVEPF